MLFFDRCEDLPASAMDAVVAIGNFDGVHRGHCVLLARAREIAEKAEKPLGVLTFEPHPRRLFRPDDPPFLLTPLPVKSRLLEDAGVDIVYALPFDWPFASRSAEDFIAHVLKDGINATHIVIGADFRFGQLRKGAPEMIREAGLAVTTINKVEGIGSSAIRELLRQGDIKAANELLGREWEIEGVVVKGDQRGRTIGYPTANVHLSETLHPAYGVYATWVRIVEDGSDAPWLRAATNIGIRPMFVVPVGQVEAHILDFDRDIYGKTLRIKPVARLRGEAKFGNLDQLVAQIEGDCAAVRSQLKKE